MFSYIYCVFNEHCSTHYFFYALRWNKLIFHYSYIFHYSEKYNCYACVSMTLTLFCTQDYLNKRYVMALLFPVTHENIAFYDHSYNKFLSYTNIQQLLFYIIFVCRRLSVRSRSGRSRASTTPTTSRWLTLPPSHRVGSQFLYNVRAFVSFCA